MTSAWPSSEMILVMLSCIAVFERSLIISTASDDEVIARSETTLVMEIWRSTMFERIWLGEGVSISIGFSELRLNLEYVSKNKAKGHLQRTGDKQ